MIGCATCGAAPVGSYRDGSPRYSETCVHPPIYPGSPLWDGAARGDPLILTLDEADQKLVIPVARRVAKKYKADKTAHMKYRSRPIFDVNLDGFGAELAVARYLGLEWHRGIRKLPDVGEDVEVRCVRRHDGMLAMYEYDHGPRRYVLVTGEFPKYTVRGWIMGRDGMTFDYWHPKGSQVMGFTLETARFLIPQGDLRPMEVFER